MKNTNRLSRALVAAAGAILLLLAGTEPAMSVGTWTPLVNAAPGGIGTMLILSDGTVMAQDANFWTSWYQLTPDSNGSYVNGTWSTRASMTYTRLYYSSQVLPDGRVFIAGGEYGNGTTTAEIYSPVSNTWITIAVPPGLINTNNTVTDINTENDAGFMDSFSVTLANSNVLICPVVPAHFGETVTYNAVANTWATATLVNGFDQDEATGVILPDTSIIMVDNGAQTSERFIPSLNQWIADANVPVALFDPYGDEEGAAFLLPNGKAFFMGSTPVTAVYTPSGNNSPGGWAAGPPTPNGTGQPDAPAAMMVNGKILYALSPAPSSPSNIFNMPTYFYEYDYSAGAQGTFTQAPAPGGGSSINAPTFIGRMLDLPDGTVLYTDSDSQLFVYTPDAAPLAAGRPTITAISQNSDGSYLLSGTGLNGISEGAGYGDDVQMNSNYPLIRMTNNATGNVYYARTYNWSSTGVMTGTNIITTQFVLPQGAPQGAYSLVVIANGNASAPFAFNTALEPVFAVVSDSITGGNGNGVIDFDECNNLTIVLTNEGVIAATSVEATLSSSTVGAIVAQGTAAYADIFPSNSSPNLTPFTLSTESTFVCGTPINLTLVVKCDQVTRTNFLQIPSGLLGPPDVFTSTTALPIPNNSFTPVDSPIVVSGLQSAGAVTVSVYMTALAAEGMTLQLISPSGTNVILAQNNGGLGANFGAGCGAASETTFDDAASVSIVNGQAPLIGSFQPVQSLSAFSLLSGTNLNGTWNLQVMDEFPGNTAVLQCWSLNISPEVCVDGGGQCPGADLSLSMSASPNPAFVNSNLVYTLTVSNAGPGTADNVIVVQSLPAGVGYVTTSNYPVTVNQFGSTLDIGMGSLPVYASATVSVVTIPTLPEFGTSTANVGAQESDPNTANNSASVSTLISEPAADVAITMTGSPAAVLQGEPLTYTINVTNNGPVTAEGVTLATSLPANANFVSWTASQGYVTNNGALTVLSNIGVGTNVVVTITISPTITGNITATTVASITNTEIDPILFNNTASVSTTVGPSADLGVTGFASNSPVIAGSNLSYIVTVSNTGPNAATGVQFSQTLPAGTTFVTNSLRATPTNNLITAAVTNSLASGASVLITTVVKTPALPGGVKSTNLTSIVSVSGQPGDPNTNNNVLTLVTVAEPPTVTVVAAGATVTSGSATGSVGPTGTYGILLYLQNVGTIPTTNLVAILLNSNGVTLSSGAQTYGRLLPGAPPTSGQYSFTASSTNGGTIVASLQLQDGSSNLGTVTFTFVMPVVQTFWNPNLISIPTQGNIPNPDDGPANPYPSALTVSGVNGDVSTVAVTVSNLFHTYPNDIGMVLVGPTGANCVLMSAAAQYTTMTQPATVTFSQNAAAPLSDGDQIVSGSYQPADYFASQYGVTEMYSNSPVPPGPYNTNLAVFSSVSANGTWSLYAYDFAQGDAGAISNGWGLAITTITPVNQVADLAASITASASQVVAGNNITNLWTVANNGPNAAAAYVTNILPAGLAFVTNMLPPGATSSQNGATDFCNLGSIPAGGSLIVTNVVMAVTAGPQTNTITVGSIVLDPNPVNNTATVVTTVTPPPVFLSLAPVAAAPNPVVLSNNLVYTLWVTNNGPSNALNVVGTFTSSSNFKLVGSNISQGSFAAGNYGVATKSVQINLGTLANGVAAEVVLTNTALSAGVMTNVWSVTTTCTNLNFNNNSSSAQVTVILPTAVISNGPVTLLSQGGPPFNGAINPSQTNTVSFVLTNIGSGATTNLWATLLSATDIRPITLSNYYGAIPVGGSAAQSFAFAASGSPGATVTVELSLKDGNNASLGPVFFNFLIPMTQTFNNTGVITIPFQGPATPYPSEIQVTGMSNLLVSQATATLNGFAHSWPHDVEAVLVSPAGQELMLMEHAGSFYSVSNLNLTFQDGVGSELAFSNALSTGTFLATEYSPFDILPGVAPVPAGSTNLATFNGMDPDGIWSLYVYDDSAGNDGIITSGWSLGLTAVSTVNPAARLAVSTIEAPSPVNTGSPVNYQITVNNLGPQTATGVYLTNIIPTGTTLASPPVIYPSGTTTTNGQTLTCNLGTISNGASATVTIQVIAGGPGSITNTATAATASANLYLAGATSVNVTSVAGSSQPASLSASYSAGTLHLKVAGNAEETYKIQASTNLHTWTTISTNTGSFTNSESTLGAPQMFYRAVQVSP